MQDHHSISARPEAPSAKAHRIPSLDGLRAISIGLVVVSHLCGTRNFLGTRSLDALGDLGQLGVRIFFVISGFLITTLLLQELSEKKTISLADFYTRRFFRIFPAYYTFLAVVGLCAYFHLAELRPGDLVHAASYTFNYHPNHAWLLGHTWSLSVEEQFYLVWPLILLIGGKRTGMYVAAGCLVVAPLLRTIIWFSIPELRQTIGTSFLTVADSIATGCLLAGLRGVLDRNEAFHRWTSSSYFWLIPLAGFLANMAGRSPRFSYPIGQSVTNLGIAFVINWSINLRTGRAARFLNSRALAAIGIGSYSLYLWQQPFLNRTAPGIIHTFPLNLLGAGLTAAASYFLVEKPFLGLRGRLASNQLRTRSASRISSPASPLP